MNGKTGHVKLLEQFRADGVRYIFGNPGTSEEGLLDALRGFSDMEYVLCLQESIAVAMADGYARSTQRPAVVQLHSGVGLGNGIGMLYQAMRGHSPLVVITGEAGVKYDNMDGQMAVNLVDVAKPVVKYATRVLDPHSVIRVIRRAFKMAATPPTGPVFVALPQDILDQDNDEEVCPTVYPSTRVTPDTEAVNEAATLLVKATKPLILMGDGVSRSGGQEELAQLAEALGAEVWGVNSSEVNLPASHPLYCGVTGHMFGSTSEAIVADADAILICGTYVFPEVFPTLGNPFKPGAKIIHVELNPYEIAKNHAVDIAFVADPKLTLGQMAEAAAAIMTPGEKEAAAKRAAAIGTRNREHLEEAKAADVEQSKKVPPPMSAFAAELARQAPQEIILFDEALTASPGLTRYLPPDRPGHFFQTRGGSLGVGIPGATGIKLAHPDKTVVAVSGDGGAMYTIQALYTAVLYKVDAKFVVCTNGGYKLLKLNIQRYWQDLGIEDHPFPPFFDIGPPILQFTDIAKSMGVSAERIDTPDAIPSAIERMLKHEGPYLIDLVIPEEVPGEVLPPPACGQ